MERYWQSGSYGQSCRDNGINKGIIMLKTVSSITNAIGALNYKGTWNATANTPALASGAGVKGDYYVVGTAGSTALDGISNWGIGDWAAFNGSVWQRVEGGADLNGVNLSASGTVNFSGLTASKIVFTDGSKNLSSTGTVAVAEGGTNGAATPTAGAVAYGTGTAYAFTSAGTAGQVLTSGGSGAPAFNSVINVQNSYAKMTNTGTVFNASGSYHEFVQSLSNNFASYVVCTNASGGYGIVITTPNAAINNTTTKFLECTDSAATRLTIFSNGDVANTNGTYGTLSDAKLKADITAASSQWDDVKALAKIMSKFRLVSDATGKSQLGWIAQDVQKVSPGLVFSTLDTEVREIAPAVPEIRDAEGNVIEQAQPAQTAIFKTGKSTLGIHHSVAQLKAFKALGEALERIELLEIEIKSLKGV